jgi:NAD(P)-dependent dehydrogenase (short-subunit alcohol dehydrogenase family)
MTLCRPDNGPVSNSYVVTGGGRGVGRAIVERLAGADDTVVIIEMDETAADWVPDHPAAGRARSNGIKWISLSVERRICMAGDGVDKGQRSDRTRAVSVGGVTSSRDSSGLTLVFLVNNRRRTSRPMLDG